MNIMNSQVPVYLQIYRPISTILQNERIAGGFTFYHFWRSAGDDPGMPSLRRNAGDLATMLCHILVAYFVVTALKGVIQKGVVRQSPPTQFVMIRATPVRDTTVLSRRAYSVQF